MNHFNYSNIRIGEIIGLVITQDMNFSHKMFNLQIMMMQVLRTGCLVHDLKIKEVD